MGRPGVLLPHHALHLHPRRGLRAGRCVVGLGLVSTRLVLPTAASDIFVGYFFPFKPFFFLPPAASLRARSGGCEWRGPRPSVSTRVGHEESKRARCLFHSGWLVALESWWNICLPGPRPVLPSPSPVPCGVPRKPNSPGPRRPRLRSRSAANWNMVPNSPTLDRYCSGAGRGDLASWDPGPVPTRVAHCRWRPSSHRAARSHSARGWWRGRRGFSALSVTPPPWRAGVAHAETFKPRIIPPAVYRGRGGSFWSLRKMHSECLEIFTFACVSCFPPGVFWGKGIRKVWGFGLRMET